MHRFWFLNVAVHHRSRSPRSFRIMTDERGILRVAGSPPPDVLCPASATSSPAAEDVEAESLLDTPRAPPRTSTVAPAWPASAPHFTAATPGTSRSTPAPGSTAATPASASSSQPPPCQRRGAFTADNQRELYCKYLSVSTELKEYLKKQLQIDTAELKEQEREKLLLETQCCRVTLDIKEKEKEKMKQEIEIKELEKEKLKLEIQLLKDKSMDTND